MSSWSYGRAPVPLLPRSLRELWASVPAPHTLSIVAGRGLVLGELDASFWNVVPSVNRTALDELANFVRGRVADIRSTRAVADNGLAPIKLRALALSTRAINCLNYAGLFRDIQALRGVTFGELLDIPTMGVKTVLEIACVIEAAHSVEDNSKNEHFTADNVSPSSEAIFAKLGVTHDAPNESALKYTLQEIQLVAAWAHGERRLKNLGDVLDIPPEEWPQEVLKAWNRILDIEASRLAGNYRSAYEVPALIGNILGAFSEREREVVFRRILALNAETLEHVGSRLDVTRERARQIQSQASNRLQAVVEQRRFAPVRRWAGGVGRSLGAAAASESEHARQTWQKALAGFSQNHELVSNYSTVCREMALWLAGPYEMVDGWLIDSRTRGRIEATGGELLAGTDEGGFIGTGEVEAILRKAGMRPEFHEQWISHLGILRSVEGGYLDITGNVVDLSVRALHRIGRPATTDAILAEVGEDYSARGVRNRLTESNQVVRVSKEHFGLPEWKHDEYTGISDEIAQEIEACGGVSSLEHLVAVLPTRYGIKPNSVRLYARSPRFILDERGSVRLRRGDDAPFESGEKLALTRDCFWISGRWVLRVLVDRDVLRGSGRRFPPAFAEHLGIAPGTQQTLAWSGGDVYIGWPMNSPQGPALGSLRGLAERLGASEGGWLYLAVENGSVWPRLVEAQELTQLTGLDRLVVEVGYPPSRKPDLSAIAVAIFLRGDANASDIRHRFRQRGENRLADMLPGDDPSPSTVREALSGLRNLFEE